MKFKLFNSLFFTNSNMRCSIISYSPYRNCDANLEKSYTICSVPEMVVIWSMKLCNKFGHKVRNQIVFAFVSLWIASQQLHNTPFSFILVCQLRHNKKMQILFEMRRETRLAYAIRTTFRADVGVECDIFILLLFANCNLNSIACLQNIEHTSHPHTVHLRHFWLAKKPFHQNQTSTHSIYITLNYQEPICFD